MYRSMITRRMADSAFSNNIITSSTFKHSIYEQTTARGHQLSDSLAKQHSKLLGAVKRGIIPA